MARIIEFFDGAQSETTPTIGNIVASSLVRYADDADYEANEQGSPTDGNIYFNETLNLIRYYNGTEWISLVDESSAQTLTSKSMDGDLNTFTDIDLPSLKTQLADANKFIIRNALGQVISLKTVPAGEVVGTTDTQTLTNKTIDADLNTITNIDNADIKVGAGIDVTKIGSGLISNTEFDYLDGVTSNIQTQFTGKQSISEKGQVNGYASLDGGGKVPVTQLPSTVMTLEGQWNAATNTPTLSDGTGDVGQIYEATVAGTVDFGNGPYTFIIGDWAVYGNNGRWYKSINSNQVNSVAGKTGTVSLVIDDNTDVTITTPANGQIIQYNGSQWVNVTPSFGASNLDALADVTITTPAIGQRLQYNGSQWVNVTDNLNNLTDVDTVTVPPVTNNVLRYNGTLWAPANLPVSNLNVSIKTATYLATSTDDVLLVDATSASFTITLPTAVGNTGKRLIFQKITAPNLVTVDANASETIDGALTYVIGSQFGRLIIISNGTNWITEQRDTVSARYTSSAGQSIPAASNTIINFGTKIRDTHNAVTTGASWKFTAPESGNYLVTTLVSFANATFTAGNGTNIKIFLNNGGGQNITQTAVHSTTTLSAFTNNGSDTIFLNAGDFIDLRLAHGEGTARALLADPDRVHVSIDRIGN